MPVRPAHFLMWQFLIGAVKNGMMLVRLQMEFSHCPLLDRSILSLIRLAAESTQHTRNFRMQSHMLIRLKTHSRLKNDGLRHRLSTKPTFKRAFLPTMSAR